MDVISHGLWGSLAFGRRGGQFKFWLAFIIGMAPDIFAFGPFMITELLDPSLRVRPDYSSGHPDLSHLPSYIFTLYNMSHSFVVFLIVFLLLWWLLKKPVWELGAWALHILLDIPSHSLAFFATPFLWPVSDIKFDGIPWGRPIIFFTNWIALIILYSAWIFHKRRKKANALSLPRT